MNAKITELRKRLARLRECGHAHDPVVDLLEELVTLVEEQGAER